MTEQQPPFVFSGWLPLQPQPWLETLFDEDDVAALFKAGKKTPPADSARDAGLADALNLAFRHAFLLLASVSEAKADAALRRGDAFKKIQAHARIMLDLLDMRPAGLTLDPWTWSKPLHHLQRITPALASAIGAEDGVDIGAPDQKTALESQRQDLGDLLDQPLPPGIEEAILDEAANTDGLTIFPGPETDMRRQAIQTFLLSLAPTVLALLSATAGIANTKRELDGPARAGRPRDWSYDLYRDLARIHGDMFGAGKIPKSSTARSGPAVAARSSNRWLEKLFSIVEAKLPSVDADHASYAPIEAIREIARDKPETKARLLYQADRDNSRQYEPGF